MQQFQVYLIVVQIIMTSGKAILFFFWDAFLRRHNAEAIFHVWSLRANIGGNVTSSEHKIFKIGKIKITPISNFRNVRFTLSGNSGLSNFTEFNILYFSEVTYFGSSGISCRKQNKYLSISNGIGYYFIISYGYFWKYFAPISTKR